MGQRARSSAWAALGQRLGQRWGAALGKVTANDSTKTDRKTEHTMTMSMTLSTAFITSLTCPGTTPLMRQSSQGKAGAGIYQYLPGPGREPGSTSIYEIYT